MITSLAEQLALLVALTSMDSDRRNEFHALLARVRRQEITLSEIYRDTHDPVVHVDFRRAV